MASAWHHPSEYSHEEIREAALDLAEALCANRLLIPRGKVSCYSSVGDAIGRDRQLVALACSLLGEMRPPSEIPYHRIVRKNGRLPLGNAHVSILRNEGVNVEKANKYWFVRPFQDYLAKPVRRRRK